MWHSPRLLNLAANLLLIASGGALLIGGGWWGIHRPMFMINSIRIEATHADKNIVKPHFQYINAVNLEATVHQRQYGSFFTVQLDDIRQQFETVPWVRRASVRRVWPNSLSIQLEEHIPLALWQAAKDNTENSESSDDVHLLSRQGELFTANAVDIEELDLPQLHGPNDSEGEVAQRYLRANQVVNTMGLKVKQFELTDRRAWWMRLNNQVIVELGKDSGVTQTKQAGQDSGGVFESRLQRLTQLYPAVQAKLGKTIDVVDIRYAHGLVIKGQSIKLLSPEELKRQDELAKWNAARQQKEQQDQKEKELQTNREARESPSTSTSSTATRESRHPIELKTESKPEIKAAAKEDHKDELMKLIGR
jgi:cell division protein FtsQ